MHYGIDGVSHGFSVKTLTHISKPQLLSSLYVRKLLNAYDSSLSQRFHCSKDNSEFGSISEHTGTHQTRVSLRSGNLIRRGHYDVTTLECCSVDEQRAEFLPGKRTLAQREGVYPPLVLRHDKSMKSAPHRREPRVPCRQSHNTLHLDLKTHAFSECHLRMFSMNICFYL